MYSGLIYGVKGLSHWNGSTSSTNLNNLSLQHRELIKNVHKKILDNEDVLLSLQFQSAYHKTIKSTIRPGNEIIPAYSYWSNFSSDPLAKDIFKVSNPLIAQSGSTIDSLAVSFMTDYLGNRYFWVFNKSLKVSENIQLNLKDGSGVIDVLRGELCLLPQNTVIHLEPAEAKLFKFIPNIPVIAITGNTTWNSQKVVEGKVIIESSNTLTIKSNVLLGACAYIVIHPGGKLIIDGGTLTNACIGEMWGGITVMGDATKPLQQQYQGYVEIVNNGKIENAVCGITVQGGGMVEATNADFVNNTTQIKFEPVEKGQTGTSGTFTYTNFEINSNYIGNQTNFVGHLLMDNCGNVLVKGTTFTSPVSTKANAGIIVSNLTKWSGVCLQTKVYRS